MTWKANTVLDSLAGLLSADTSFTTVGYSEISYDEQESLKPIVQIHIAKGDMHSVGTGVVTDFQHTFIIQFDIIASAAAEFDLSVLDNDLSTPTDKADAILNGRLATGLAHNKAYAVFQSVFNIVNGVENYDLGLDEYTVKGREFGDYEIKDTILTGNFATIFLVAELKVMVVETVDGLIPEESEDPPVQGVVDGENAIPID